MVHTASCCSAPRVPTVLPDFSSKVALPTPATVFYLLTILFKLNDRTDLMTTALKLDTNDTLGGKHEKPRGPEAKVSHSPTHRHPRRGLRETRATVRPSLVHSP